MREQARDGGAPVRVAMKTANANFDKGFKMRILEWNRKVALYSVYFQTG